MVEAMKIMAGTGTAALNAPNPAQGGHHSLTPPLATLGHSWGSLGQSLVGSQHLSPGSWCAQGFVCAVQDAQDLEKAEEPEIKLILWITEKTREFQKTSTSALLTMPKSLTVWITTKWKVLKEMRISDHLTCLLRKLYAGREATVRTGHGTTV